MLNLKNLTNCFFAIYLYARNGMLTVVNDRAMFFTDFVMGTLSPFIVQLILWSAIFSEERDSVNNFEFNDIIYYYAFALILSRLNNGYDLIRILSEHIREGALEVWLTKPFSYLTQRLFTFLGESMLYAIPLLVIYMIKRASMDYEGSAVFTLLSALLTIILVIFLSQLLCFLLSFSLSLLSFWVIEYNILLSFSILSSALLGGVLLPPSFWPEWLMPLMKYNPWHFIISAPAEYLTTYNQAILHHFLLGSVAYIMIISLFVRVVWNKGMKVYNGAGG